MDVQLIHVVAQEPELNPLRGEILLARAVVADLAGELLHGNATGQGLQTARAAEETSPAEKWETGPARENTHAEYDQNSFSDIQTSHGWWYAGIL